MCTVKELKDYLATIPDGVEVYVMQEDSRSYTMEMKLDVSDPSLVEYHSKYNQLVFGGYA